MLSMALSELGEDALGACHVLSEHVLWQFHRTYSKLV